MMLLPDRLHELRFEDWNFAVRGLMEIWELARLTGVEGELEALLREDHGGALTDRLARLGNECCSLAPLVRHRLTNRREVPQLDLASLTARNYTGANRHSTNGHRAAAPVG